MRRNPYDWIDRRPTEALIKRELHGRPNKVSAGGWCEGWDGERWGDTIQEIPIEAWRKIWGTPDWREAGDYPNKMAEQGERSPDKNALTLDQWRWDFLRRDSEYRDAWDYFTEGKMTCAEGVENNYDLLNDDDAYRAEEHFDYWGNYGLGCMINPNRAGRDVPRKLFMRQNQGQRYTKLSADVVAGLLTDTRYAVLVFDTHRPLAEQIDRARKRLDVLQKEEKDTQNTLAQDKGKVGHRRGADFKIDDVIIKNPPPETLRRLLRVYDAYLERAPIKEVGEVLYNSKDYANTQSRYNKEIGQASRMWEWL